MFPLDNVAVVLAPPKPVAPTLSRFCADDEEVCVLLPAAWAKQFVSTPWTIIYEEIPPPFELDEIDGPLAKD